MGPAGTLLFSELTRDEARVLGTAGVIVVPFGATEQHGPHLPLGTDTIHVESVVLGAAKIAAESVPLAVAPTLPYGCSAHHVPFSGTMSISSTTFLEVVGQLCRSLVAGGAERLFLVNGHGGNQDVLRVAARDLALELEVAIAVTAWWDPAASALAAARTEIGARVPGHAGAFESSVCMALRPDLVRTPPSSRMELPPWATAASELDPPAYRIERHGAWLAFDGFTDDPGTATAERGKAYVEVAVRSLAEAIVEFARSGRPAKPMSTRRRTGGE